MPQLRNGVPRDQKKQQLPPKQRPCTCFECANTWTMDRATKALFRGQYIGITEWNQHRRHTLQAGIAEAHLAEAAIGLSLPSMEFPRHPDLFSPPFANHLTQNTKSQLDRSVGGNSSNSSLLAHTRSDGSVSEQSEELSDSDTPLVFGRRLRRMRPREESEDALTMRGLREIKLSLEKQGTERSMSAPLVFAHPPSEYLVTGRISYELDDEASVNTDLIGEEEWLSGAKNEVEGMKLNTSLARCTAKVLLADIDARLDAIFDLKTKEWHLQHNAAIASGENVYDSSKFF